jgi:hypothetical protein
MKATIASILFSFAVVASDMNDVQVFTTSSTNTESGCLDSLDVFTRAGRTNLVRKTQTKDGVVLFRMHTFYHRGAEMGRYIFNGSENIIGSTPGAPYHLSFRFGTSNELRSAIIGTIRTNGVASESVTVVTLDSFGCTNGLFYPRDGSWLREVNSMSNTFSIPR